MEIFVRGTVRTFAAGSSLPPLPALKRGLPPGVDDPRGLHPNCGIIADTFLYLSHAISARKNFHAEQRRRADNSLLSLQK